MRTGWLLALLVLAGGLGGWLLLRERPDESGADGAMGRSVDAPPAEPLLEGLRREPTREAQRGPGVIAVRVQRDGAPAEAEVSLTLVLTMAAFERKFEDPGAFVERLFRFDPEPVLPVRARVRTQDGACEFRELPWGVYRVEARAADGAEASGLAGLQKQRPRGEATLALSARDGVLQGRVRWSDGRPVAGRVSVDPGAEGGMVPGLQGAAARVELDAEGRFEVGGLTAGLYSVRVVTPEGLVAIDLGAVVPAREPFELTLDIPTVSVSGRVVSAVDEAPIAGASLLCQLNQGGGDLRMAFTRAVSAPDGSFSLLLVELPAQIQVLGAGFRPGQLRAKEAHGAVARLAPLGRVVGRVVAAADGAPIAGAGVVVAQGPRELEGVSGADGHFAIDGVQTDEVTVFVRGGGWVSPGLAGEDGDSDVFERKIEVGKPLELELKAVRSATLEGRVIDAGGTGIAGVGVLARPPDRAFQQRVGLPRWVDLAETNTAADGSFRLEDLPPGGTVMLEARAGSGERAESGPHEPGGPAVEIRLGTSRWVHVTVLYADDGKPVVGAHPSLVARSGSGRHSSGGPMTGPDGKTRLGPLRPGDGALSIAVSGADLEQGQPETPVDTEGTGDAHVTVKAQRGLEVHGRVLFTDGTAASGASVRVRPAGQDEGRGFDVRRHRTAADGSFRLRGLPAGEIELEAELDRDGVPLRGTVRATSGSRDVVLQLVDRSGEFVTLRVRVFDPQGRPVPRADVRLHEGSGSSQGGSLSDGVTQWRTSHGTGFAVALAAGELSVEVARARDEEDRPLPLGSARVGPLAPDQRFVDVRLPPERAIEGRVLDAEGRPLAGVGLSAVLVDEDEDDDFYYEMRSDPDARSDADGRFRLGQLGDAAHRIRVHAPAEYLTPEFPSARPGAAPLEIRLTRGVSVRVRVLDASGAPVPGAQVAARVRVSAEGQRPQDMWAARRAMERHGRSGRTGRDGIVRLHGLDASRSWDLAVNAPSDHRELLPQTREQWVPGDTEVRLASAFSINGRVQDREGAPIPTAIVYSSTGGGGWQGNGVDPKGAFRVGGLKAGDQVSLMAVPAQGVPLDPTQPPLAVVAAGASDVVLTIDAGARLTVLLDAPDSDRLLAGLQLMRPSTRRPRGVEFAHHGPPPMEGGRAVYVGLDRATPYLLWLHVPATGQYAMSRDVRAGGPPLVLRLETGAKITGRLTLPTGAENSLVVAEQGELQVQGRVQADGSYEISGLPAGRWRVTAQALVAEAWLKALGEVEAGASLDLTLAPR